MNLKEEFKKKGYKWTETENKLIYKQKFLFFTCHSIVFDKKMKIVFINGYYDYSFQELIMKQSKELKFDESLLRK